MASDALVVDVSDDWIIASDVQQRFMHGLETGLDTLDYSAGCRQLRALGGDCFDFVTLGANRLALAIGDASGKGLAAALMIANVQSSLRTAALLAGSDGASVLGAVNRQVHASSLANRYATMFYGVVDAAEHTLRYVNAGHNPPMVIRPDGSILWLEAGGAPIGMFPGWTYREGMVQVHPGDLLLAYTDGVIEAVNAAGEEWGIEASGRRRWITWRMTRRGSCGRFSPKWMHFRSGARWTTRQFWPCASGDRYAKNGIPQIAFPTGRKSLGQLGVISQKFCVSGAVYY